MPGRWRGACAAGLVLLALAACRQLVGIGDEPPTDLTDASAPKTDGPTHKTDGGADADAGADVDAAPSCGLSFPAGACSTCMQTGCCAAAETCSQNPACAAFMQCIGGCQGNVACRARCLGDHPVGTTPSAPALLTCLEDRCQNACQLACGGLPFTVQPDAASSCYDCVSASGCDAASACLTNAECEAVVFCTFATRTGDTRQACGDGRDAGEALWSRAKQQAYGGACATQCEVGQNWYCAGKVTWPTPVGPQIATTVTVEDVPHMAVEPGVTVSACSVLQPACSPPLVSGATDSTGQVTLTWPDAGAGSAALEGFFEVGSIDAGAGTDLYPELDFIGYPLTEPTSQFALYVVTRDELAAFLPAGVTLDPTRGHALLTAKDCIFGGSAGVTFDVTAGGTDGGEAPTLLYQQGIAFSAGASATDSSGNALLVNVPPGGVVVRARPQALGGAVSSTQSFYVRAGTLSLVNLLPTP